MGTRHMVAVVSGGEYRVAQYGQWDGYPSGQGASILDFLRKGNVDGLKTNVLKCSFITNKDYKEMWKEFGVDVDKQSFVDGDVSAKFLQKYPQLSRDVGSDILKMIADAEGGLKLQDNYNFAADSLFCEWAYVIDFDKETFEVYQGFNETPLDKNERFFGVVCGRDNSDKDTYYPVKLKAMFSLLDLPDEEEFLFECDPPEDEEVESDG